MDKSKDKSDEKEEKKPIIIRNSTDLQRLKLEKLMKNPDKPVIIPEKPKERGGPAIPDFVRNVMGSSAGAGSGEFHVYRHLRRKEYARQKYMKEKAEKEKMEEEYHNKLEENKKKAEERTAKKRMKRLKRKQKQKNVKRKNTVTKKDSSSSEESDTDGKESSENVMTTIDEERIIGESRTKDQVQNETNENCMNKSDEVVDGKESSINEYQETKIETSKTVTNESQVDISKNIDSESDKT